MPIEVKMPRLSDTMEVGTVVKWNVKPGQKVRSGDVIADIETDKATMELQTFDDGTVAELAVQEGSSVKVGTIILRLAGANESVDQAKRGSASPAAAAATAEAPASSAPAGISNPAPNRAGERATAPSPSARPTPAPAFTERHGVITSAASSERVFASPLARKIAQENNMSLTGLTGSGPSGRIVRKDVEEAVAGSANGSHASAHVASARGGEVRRSMPVTQPLSARSLPLSNMRATIARRLVQSKTTIPHYQVTVAVRMDNLLTLRSQLNEQLAAQGVKLSVNDFLVRACALAMHQHPHVNSRWNDQGTSGGPSVDLQADANIGIAIALPVNERGEGGGLVVATIRNADHIGLRQISADSKRLSEKARGKGLSVEEMSDTTFTISNLGMFGVEHFTAIINPPNVAILAVGAAVEQPVVETDAAGKKTLGIGHVMQMTMSSDHRVVDGAMAAAYLATVRELLEKPATLLV